MTLLCKKMTVVKSKVKSRSNLAESSKEGYGSNRAVLPMMVMMVVVVMMMMMMKGNNRANAQELIFNALIS
jgi:sensor domain CHASE-containing protein